MVKKKSEEKIEKKKIYPSLVLGLDISTACIGISLVYDEDGIKDPVIVELTHIVPKLPSKNIKGIEALIRRKQIFEDEFLASVRDRGITECVIEAPLKFASARSNAETVAQLLQFNGLLSEAVYRVLGLIPVHVSSYDARMQSFPSLLALRKFNKKGELYPISHFKKAIKEDKLILFGSYPFDCDKKNIMMNMVSEKYPDIDWIKGKNGELKKENFDACDSLVCALAYINTKRYGDVDAKIAKSEIFENGDNYEITYTVSVWGKEYVKKVVVPKDKK